MVNAKEVLERARAAFNSGKTRDIQWRKKQLLALIEMIDKEEQGFVDAVYKDLHKHRHETVAMELNLAKNDAVTLYNNLDDWAGPQKVKKNLLTFTDDCYTLADPYGVVLLIGAWNYPIQLVLMPLAGAIGAGNCCVIKPSELAEHTASFLEEVLPKYLDSDCFQVVNGGIPETQALLTERFDFIFYTGSSMVGKIVAEAASRYLTPTILELGGKSPVYIDDTCNFDIVANRLLWGRLVNTGQTCIAPDYVMCTKEVQVKLLEKMKATLKTFYADDAQKSDSYGRIINKRHFERVKSYIDSSRVAIGGHTDASECYIEPTVLADCKPDDKAMQEEIFGPVLPIMPVKDVDDAINFINSRDKPLAMYIFSKRKDSVTKILRYTTAGGVTVNDTIMHAGMDTLPFGGVGNSGQGSYHGKFTFEAFSHKKAVQWRKQAMEQLNNLRYPPYSDRKTSIISWVMTKPLRKNAGLIRGFFGLVKLVLFGIALGWVGKRFGVDKYLPKIQ